MTMNTTQIIVALIIAAWLLKRQETNIVSEIKTENTIIGVAGVLGVYLGISGFLGGYAGMIIGTIITEQFPAIEPLFARL